MDKQRTILIVDDEIHISNLLKTNLNLEGYNTIVAENGQQALNVIDNRHIDLILLDVMLPDISGMDLCAKIKRERRTLPILMLSALGQSNDRIKGLQSGADDYLGKPFNLTELLLRIENVLDRYVHHQSNNLAKFSLGAAQIDLDNSLLIRDGEVHILTEKEVSLLRYMIRRSNQVINRKEILDEVWGYDVYPTTRTIDNFVAKYRKLIESNPNKPQVIKTVRGVGYILIR